jgi:SAM-dependent methyltransferase
MQGKILQLGRQTTFLRLNKMRQISRQFGLDTQENYLAQFPEETKVSDSDITLFQSLGFDSVESMDYSDYESPTHVHDFNLPVPDELHEQYDVIFDGGTLEHIFNFPESLKNIYKLLKVGGVVIHASPSSNHVDHGFYMFSPTVFYDYYLSNGFEIIKSYIFEYERRHDANRVSARKISRKCAMLAQPCGKDRKHIVRTHRRALCLLLETTLFRGFLIQCTDG